MTELWPQILGQRPKSFASLEAAIEGAVSSGTQHLASASEPDQHWLMSVLQGSVSSAARLPSPCHLC